MFKRGQCIGEYTGLINGSSQKLLKKKANKSDENPITCKDLHGWSVKIIDGFHVVSEVTGFGMKLLNHRCHSPNCNTVVTVNDSGDLVILVVAICDIPVNTVVGTMINYR